MQAVFEKIIEKLNSKKAYFQRFYECEGKSEHDADLNKSTQLAFEDAIEIIKQEAAEYEECYKDCGECEAYDKEKYHCPKFCKVIKETVKEIEENHNGWISCSEQLPEEAFGCLVTIMDCEPSTQTDFENILPYFVGYDGETWNDADGKEIPFEVIAWMPLPEPYQPKGE